MILTLPLIPSLILFLILLFTREKNTKKKYSIKVCAFFAISIVASNVVLPMYALFGIGCMLFNAVVLGTIFDFKEKTNV